MRAAQHNYTHRILGQTNRQPCGQQHNILVQQRAVRAAGQLLVRHASSKDIKEVNHLLKKPCLVTHRSGKMGSVSRQQVIGKELKRKARAAPATSTEQMLQLWLVALSHARASQNGKLSAGARQLRVPQQRRVQQAFPLLPRVRRAKPPLPPACTTPDLPRQATLDCKLVSKGTDCQPACRHLAPAPLCINVCHAQVRVAYSDNDRNIDFSLLVDAL